MGDARRNKTLLQQASVFALVVAALAGAAAREAVADEVKMGGTGAALGTLQRLSGAFAKSHPDIRITIVPNLGSSGGIRAAIKGAVDIGLSSRALKDDERATGAAALEYGRTPFVFAVSTKSKANAVTVAQLIDMYAGRIKTWPDGSLLRIVLRPESDIDTDYTRRISPAMDAALSEARKRPGVPVSITDQDAADDIEKIPGALGTSSLAVILSEGRALRALKLDGVEPTVKNASAGIYPHYKQMYFVTGAQASASARRFIAFTRSNAGREILLRTGHWIPADEP